MFWEKFQYLSKIKGIKPHAVLKELEISSGSANNWKKGTIPNGEILKKIADYFEVSIDSLLDFDENVSVRLRAEIFLVLCHNSICVFYQNFTLSGYKIISFHIHTPFSLSNNN